MVSIIEMELAAYLKSLDYKNMMSSNFHLLQVMKLQMAMNQAGGWIVLLLLKLKRCTSAHQFWLPKVLFSTR